MPTGGTTGQVLAKVDGTDYNTEWITPSAGGGGWELYDDTNSDFLEKLWNGDFVEAILTFGYRYGASTTPIAGTVYRADIAGGGNANAITQINESNATWFYSNYGILHILKQGGNSNYMTAKAGVGTGLFSISNPNGAAYFCDFCGAKVFNSAPDEYELQLEVANFIPSYAGTTVRVPFCETTITITLSQSVIDGMVKYVR